MDESAAAYEVVDREAIRALDLQRSSFDSLRARVGFLLSAATIECLEPAEGDAQELSIIYRDLVLFAEEAHDYNRDEHLKPLTNYFRLAITLLTAEIVAWVVDLAIRKDASHGEASSDRFHQSDAAVSGRREAAEIGSVSVLNG